MFALVALLFLGVIAYSTFSMNHRQALHEEELQRQREAEEAADEERLKQSLIRQQEDEARVKAEAALADQRATARKAQAAKDAAQRKAELEEFAASWPTQASCEAMHYFWYANGCHAQAQK